MEPTPEAILDFAARRARETWEAQQQPYLLSRLSPELSKEGIDYKGILGEQRLKEFMRTAPAGRIKVVTHKTQKSRIGLIPADQEFEFETVAEAVAQPPLVKPSGTEKGKRSWRAYIVSNFLQLVSELDEAEAAQVQIPLPLLTKLMRDQ